jgi:hypothetical protein
MRDIIRSNRCNLWLLLALLHSSLLSAQQYPGHRFSIGAGTLLLIPDSTAGLTLWATRATRPGQNPSPDFVGWFAPESIPGWASEARRFLSGSGAESAALLARDGGGVSLIRLEDACCAVAFGHPSEQQRWVIEGSSAEILEILDSLDPVAQRARLEPPQDLGYANPTNRRATPDRTVAPTPAFRTDSGEVWARMTLDARGEVIPGTASILWASRKDMGDAVVRVLSGYRYHRKDGKTRKLVVYQRFRVSGER